MFRSSPTRDHALPSKNAPQVAVSLVVQPLRDAGVLDPDHLARTVALVESRIAAGTWLDAVLMLRVTGEKR